VKRHKCRAPAAKLAVGYQLDELKNDIARETSASFLAQLQISSGLWTIGYQRCTSATRRTTRPISPTVFAKHRAQEDDDGKEHALNRARHDQSQLRVPMAMEDMGHVKHRRPSLRAGVDHFEKRLEVSVQINCGRRDALKHQFLVAVIPPPMRASDGKTRAPARLNLNDLSVQRSGEDAGNHFAVFVFAKMDVEWRTLAVRRERSRQKQFFDAVRVSGTTQREPFASVFDLDRQGWLFVWHRLSKRNWEHFLAQADFQRATFIRARSFGLEIGFLSDALGFARSWACQFSRLCRRGPSGFGQFLSPFTTTARRSELTRGR
jgi:hypothetical protein